MLFYWFSSCNQSLAEEFQNRTHHSSRKPSPASFTRRRQRLRGPLPPFPFPDPLQTDSQYRRHNHRRQPSPRVFFSSKGRMTEAADWESSSGGASEKEAYLQYINYDDDNEEHYFKSWFTSKMQFRKDKSTACWIDEIGMAQVVENKGKMWTTMGIVRGGKTYYSIEETLFLMEIGALLLMDDNDTSLSIKDIYAKVSGSAWELFEVYRHLKSLGYIVGRHGIAWSTKGVKSSSQSVSLQGSPQSSEVDVELKDERSIIGLFNDFHINEARAVFDVYLPNSRFRKSSPGNPRFVLCLTRGDPPSIADVEVLERQCGGFPLLFCHVEYGRVCYFSFEVVELPILP